MFYQRRDSALEILGVYQIHRGERKVQNRKRNFATLSYRIHGSTRFTQGEITQIASDASTVFLPAGTEFESHCTENEEILVVHLRSFGFSQVPLTVLENTRAAEPLFRKLLSQWEEGGPFAYNRCMALIYTIFETLQALSAPREDSVSEIISPGVMKIRKEFRDPHLTVEQAAGACFISEVYFRRLYRKQFGLSPLQEILNLRFDYAKGLLRSGYYSDEEVARLSGFSEVKYFRTAFSRRFGLSPRAWKKAKSQESAD